MADAVDVLPNAAINATISEIEFVGTIETFTA